ncbi:ArnT family glycosyltransferase [Actinocatenispora rupis]|uniref:4-amino-4-deoxy-L-arabinose transferase n=1 Tax=Actinocatenispora rupis TaxID=519421 RepID=A0A8J3NBV8_9ACTN|nr:hypothetical protein Aru02nite_06380 [Actinocatenispora rupis]
MGDTVSTTTLAPPAHAAPPRGRSRPVWLWPALGVLLVGTAVLYLWNLSASGYANDFYAAAVQAGTQSWKAWLFGSLDPGSGITVDKPPAALWVMGLSGRIFGFSSWSMLAPQALMGVASVALLYGAVRRVAGYVAGLAAGAVLALTPVAVVMFRFNNPDALLVLLLVAAAYATTRAISRGHVGWLVLAGSAIGFGFLTKMLQALLVLPGLALAYLVAAPVSLPRRLWHLLAAGGAMIVSAGWYVALVELWPASSRPYIGGSTTNSLLQLAVGYNGLGRIFGGGGNPGGGGKGGGGAGGGFGGATGITRMFSSEFGTEISWLLPAALVALLAGLWLTRRSPRTDRTRAALLLWGGWVLVTGLTFSYMSGIIHPYYTVALAPGIAAVLAIGVQRLWQTRSSLLSRALLAVVVVAAGAWSFVLLARASAWHPELRYAVLVLSLAAAVWLLVGGRAGVGLASTPGPRSLVVRRIAVLLAVVLAVAGIGGSAAFGAATAGTAHTGSTPSAGPSGYVSGGMGGFPGGGTSGNGRTGNAPGNGSAPGGTGNGSGNAPGGSTGPQGGRGTGGPGGEMGTNSALVALLKQSTSYRWAAATNGSMMAAPLELNSGASVLAVGGFSGGDNYPTLAQFTAYVAAHQIHYYVSEGQGGMGGGMGGNNRIASWVAAHFTAKTVGGTTVYDLTAPKS